MQPSPYAVPPAITAVAALLFGLSILIRARFSRPSILFFADTWIAGVRRFWWGYYPAYRWLGAPFLAFFFALVLLALVEFRRDHRRARAEADRQRSRWFLLAFGVGALGSLDFLPSYGAAL